MISAHKESFLQLAELGTRHPPFKPTHDYHGEFIDDYHRSLLDGIEAATGMLKLYDKEGNLIKGYLRKEDALKIYELTYFCREDVIEFGSLYGLSTCIIAMANMNSPYKKRLASVDMDPRYVAWTKRNLKHYGFENHVESICGEATEIAKTLASAQRRFGFLFIDHSHAFGPVRSLCRELKNIATQNAFCLFHDYNDRRNRDDTEEGYGVYQAVTEAMTLDICEFYGVYGCTGLYRMA
jgi:hypothetical protein